MAPVLRNAGTPAQGDVSNPSGSAAQTVSVVIPACDPGDLLLLGALVDAFVAGPAGWTFLHERPLDSHAELDGEPLLLRVYSKRAVLADSGATLMLAASGGFSDLLHPATAVVCSFDAPFGVEQIADNFNVNDPGQPHPQTMTSTPVTTVRSNQLIVELFAWRTQTGPGMSVTSAPSTSRISMADIPATIGGAASGVGMQISDQPQTTAGTTPSKSVVVDGYTLWGSLTLSLFANDAPNAPTLNTPPDGSTVNVGSPQRFSFTFSDPNPGDFLTRFGLRYRPVGGGTWTTLPDAGSVNSFLDIAGGTFTDGTSYEWQVSTYDSFGAQGPWSASFTFTGASTPGLPTITAPISDQVIGDATVTVVWSFGAQQGYQVQLWPDDGTGVVDLSGVAIFDSGQVEDGVTRSLTIGLAATGVTLHALLSCEASTLWSDFADVRFIVDFNAPPRPTLTLSTNDETPSITFYVVNPAPTGDELATAFNQIEVSVDGGETWLTPDNGVDPPTMLPVNAQWTWYLPAANRDYQGRVKAWSDAMTFSVSDPVDAAVLDPDVPDVLPPLIPGGE